jgi:hypothetical protein
MYVAFLPLPILGTVNFVTSGSCNISNQLVARSVMVSHMKLILVLSLPLRVHYCLMSSKHNILQKFIMTSLLHDVLLAVSVVFGKICKI